MSEHAVTQRLRQVDQLRDLSLALMKAGRSPRNFNRDVTGKAEADDLAAEKKRTIPTVVPKPPTKP